MRPRIAAMAIAGMLFFNVAANASVANESTGELILKPWEFTGSLTLRGTDEKGVGSDTDYRLNLTATKELLPNLTFKATVTSFDEKKFPTSDYPSKAMWLDQFALKYALPDKSSTLRVGKDDMLFGNGLIMGDNLENITFATNIDKFNIQASTFRNKYVPADAASSVGGNIQTSFNNLILGASFIKQNDGSFKNWAINSSYPAGKINLGAEYTQNMAAATVPKAYYLSAAYGSLKQQGDIRYSVGYVRMERNALPGYTVLNLTKATDYKGITMGVSYQLNPKSILTLEHNHLRDMSNSDVSRTRLTFNLTF
jgi:hypothetical protein